MKLHTVTVTLTQLSLSLVVAVCTAWLTVHLSLRRFYREKWWEAKMEAYRKVIEALHHMKRDLDISVRAEMEERDTDTPFHKEWGARHRAAWDEIRRQIDLGEFLYSRDTIKVLQDLDDDASSVPDETYMEHLLRLQGAVDKSLPAIKANARKDLRLPRIT